MTRPQGPGQGQRPAPQGQGPDPKNQDKDLKYVLKESFRTRINITGNNKQHLSFIRTPSILHVPDSIRVSFAYNSTMLHFIYNSRRLRILDRGPPTVLRIDASYEDKDKKNFGRRRRTAGPKRSAAAKIFI